MTEQKAKTQSCFCPYCDQEIIESDLPYCQTCQATIFYCPECREPLPRDIRVCPNCGSKIKG